MSKSFEAAADARVEAERAGLEDDPADRSGSTLRVASTERPDASSICATMPRASSSESSNAVVSSTCEHALLARHELVELARDLVDLAGAALLGDQAEEVADELVGAAQDVARGWRPSSRGRARGCAARRRARAPRGRWRRSRRARSCASSSRPLLLARRLEQRPRVHALRDTHRVVRRAPAPRSRGRRSPPRSGGAGRRCRAPCPSPWSSRSNVSSATSLPDLLERALRLRRDLAPRLLEPALAVGVRLLLDALALRLGDLPRLGEDRLGVASRLRRSAALVLLEQPACLLARLVGLLDRSAGCCARRSSIAFWIG